jgi:type I restriction enzyme, S subunit
MIDGLTPYPDLKPTGLPWLAAIPANWEIWRNGRLFAQRKQTGFPDLPILEVTIRSGVQKRDFDNGARKQQMTDRSKYQRAAEGDIAYNMMRMWQGAVGVAPVEGLVSPAYVVARPYPETDGRYFAYLFRTAEYMREVEIFSRGIVPDRNRLYWEAFKQLTSPVPSTEEQRLIVRFLDAHGALIARLIRAKQRVIELLEEQKQAIILRAVTRGLDPSVHLKSSGVAWLGDMPEHWQISALRHRYHQCLGKMLDTKRIRGDHLVPYLRNIDVQWDSINVDDLPTMDIQQAEYDRYLLRKGDLLVCEGGEVGRAAIWDGALEVCGFQKALHRLRPLSPGRDDPRFMMFVLGAASFSGAFADGHESTISHLTGEKLRQHRFPFPEPEEQVAIVAHIDAASAQINRITAAVEREVALLRQFRTRLVADVVTGKLDARAAAAALPEETASEPIDDPIVGEDLEEANDDVEDKAVAA